jgi:sulfur carrier protein
MGPVKVQLRNPRRELELDGPMSVTALLHRLDLHRETVLVIRSGTLVPGDEMLDDGDTIEIRPVISGGGVGLDDPYPRSAMAARGLAVAAAPVRSTS